MLDGLHIQGVPELVTDILKYYCRSYTELKTDIHPIERKLFARLFFNGFTCIKIVFITYLGQKYVHSPIAWLLLVK